MYSCYLVRLLIPIMNQLSASSLNSLVSSAWYHVLPLVLRTSSTFSLSHHSTHSPRVWAVDPFIQRLRPSRACKLSSSSSQKIAIAFLYPLSCNLSYSNLSLSAVDSPHLTTLPIQCHSLYLNNLPHCFDSPWFILRRTAPQTHYLDLIYFPGPKSSLGPFLS